MDKKTFTVDREKIKEIANELGIEVFFDTETPGVDRFIRNI